MNNFLTVSSPSINNEEEGPLLKCGSYGGRAQLQGMCCGAQNALEPHVRDFKNEISNLGTDFELYAAQSFGNKWKPYLSSRSQCR